MHEPANFTQCEARCNEVGASLACIRDEDEYERISTRNRGEDFWIGLYRRGPCSWEWTSGCGSDYEAWENSESNTRHDCAAMWTREEYRERVETWRSRPCREHLPCLCEAGRTATPQFLAWDGATHDYDEPRHLALSVLAGLLYVGVQYALSARRRAFDAASAEAPGSAAAAATALSSREMVIQFVMVAVLVYGSFQVAFSCETCKLIESDIVMQTGLQAPF